MGFQQSIVKAKKGKEEELIAFAVNDEKWFAERCISPYSAVRVSKDLFLRGSTYKKGEICLVVGGDRQYQRCTEKGGLSDLEFVDDILFIDGIMYDLNSEKDDGELLDEYFPVIKDESFYENLRQNG